MIGSERDRLHVIGRWRIWAREGHAMGTIGRENKIEGGRSSRRRSRQWEEKVNFCLLICSMVVLCMFINWN